MSEPDRVIVTVVKSTTVVVIAVRLCEVEASANRLCSITVDASKLSLAIGSSNFNLIVPSRKLNDINSVSSGPVVSPTTGSTVRRLEVGRPTTGRLTVSSTRAVVKNRKQSADVALVHSDSYLMLFRSKLDNSTVAMADGSVDWRVELLRE